MDNFRITQLVALMALAACGSGDAAERCEDDTVCVAPSFCEGGICVSPPEADQCEGEPDGAICDAGTGADSGECVSGNCVPFQCDGGDIDPNELCEQPAADGDCSDSEYGYDFGTLSCPSCNGPGTDRCGIIGWRRIGGTVLGQTGGDAVFSSGAEIWVARKNGDGYHYNGREWRADPNLRGGSVHGTSPDDIWVYNNGTVRHITNAGVDVVTLGQGDSGGIAAVSPDEVYLAGRDGDSPAIWKFDGTQWEKLSHTIASPSASSYRAIATAGGQVVAVTLGTLTVIDETRIRDVANAAIGVGNGIWARGEDDAFIAGSDGIYHFTGESLTRRFAGNSGTLVSGLGSSVYALGGGGGGPGLLREYREGESDGTPHTLEGVGFIDVEFGLSTIASAVYSDGARVVAAQSSSFGAAGPVEFTGVANTRLNLYVGIPPKTLVDVSVTGDDLYFIRNQGNAPVIGIVSDAFGRAPTMSEMPIANAGPLWGRSPTDVFVAVGNGLSRFDGIDLTPELSAAGAFRDIAARGLDSALAVGFGGLAYEFDGLQWNDVSHGSVGFSAVTASTDGYIAVGLNGAIALRRGSTWTDIRSDTSAFLRAVTGTTDEFYAAGSNGTIIHCTESGAALSCAVEQVPTTANLTAIAMAAPNDVLATAGDIGFHYDGVRWSQVNFRVDTDVSALVAQDEHIWLGSADGLKALQRLERPKSWVAVPPN